MKTIQKKLTFLLIGLCTVGLFYSFNQKKKTKNKKYEVIRTSNGIVSIYDTIVSSDSKFSPDDFIAFLGFEHDKDIQIIDVDKGSFFYKVNETDTEGTETNSNIDIKVIRIENIDELDDAIEKKEIKIIKHIESDLEGLDINIDNIIKSVTTELTNDSLIIRKMIISDFDTIIHSNGDHKIEEFRVFNPSDSDKKLQHVIVKGSETDMPDLTLLIVSDANESTEHIKKSMINQSSNIDINLFPNPATNTTQIQFNLDQKAKTTIQLIDLKGQVLQNIHLGEIIGKHVQEIDLSKQSKGTYIIKIKSGDESISQKLVIK